MRAVQTPRHIRSIGVSMGRGYHIPGRHWTVVECVSACRVTVTDLLNTADTRAIRMA